MSEAKQIVLLPYGEAYDQCETTAGNITIRNHGEGIVVFVHHGDEDHRRTDLIIKRLESGDITIGCEAHWSPPILIKAPKPKQYESLDLTAEVEASIARDDEFARGYYAGFTDGKDGKWLLMNASRAQCAERWPDTEAVDNGKEE